MSTFRASFLMLLLVIASFPGLLSAQGEHFMPEGTTQTSWGTEVVLIADIGFLADTIAGDLRSYDGVKFPFVLGYLAFSDANNELRLVFTPEPGNYDPARLLNFFDRINQEGFYRSDLGKIQIEDKDFYSDFLIELMLRYGIYSIGSGEIGYYRNFDVTFENTVRYDRDKPLTEYSKIDYGDVTYTPR